MWTRFWLVGGFCVLLVPPDASAQSTPWETSTDAGQEAYEQAHYGEAEKAWLLALKEAENFGPEDPLLATSLNNLASLYYAQGKYAEAEPLYQRSLAIREKALGPEHPDVAQSLNNLAELYRTQGKYAEAEPLYQRALAILEKALGPEHPNVATALNNLALLYYAQGKYADAEPLYKRSLAIREKALGPEHPNVATALNNLASLYRAQGKYAEAEPLYQRSLAIREKALGPEHPNVATALNNLASLYRAQGKYAEAEPLYQRSLAIREKALGPEHPDVATSLNSLALLYYAQGKYADAEPLYQRSLAIREKALGPEHPNVATALNNLAALYYAQGKYDDAEPLYQRALAIQEKALGPEHPNVATALNSLASLYYAQGKYAEAEPLYKRSLAIQEKALGPEHPDVATSLNNLALFYYAQGKYAEAEPLYKRSLAIWEKALGPEHPDVATSLNNLAELYRTQGKYAEAEPLYKRSLAIQEKALGPEHPDVATSLNNLALLYYAQGKYADAEPLYQRSLAIREKALGPEHPDVATSLNNLALLYYAQGKYADAEPLYQRSLAIREKALGPEHPDVATSLNNLALLYYAQGKYADAEPLYQRSLAIREKALGPEHPDVAQSLNNLAALYDDQGKYADAEPLLQRALAIQEKALAPDHPDVATSLENYAALLRKMNREGEADQMQARARVIRGESVWWWFWAISLILVLSVLAWFWYRRKAGPNYVSSRPEFDWMPSTWAGIGLPLLVLFTCTVAMAIYPEFDEWPLWATLLGISPLFYWLYCVYKWFYCVYKFHDAMDAVPGYNHPISATSAVAWHLVPFFNLYWVFKWPSAIAHFVNWRMQRRAMRGWIAGLLGLFALLLFQVLGLFLISATFSWPSVSDLVAASMALSIPGALGFVALYGAGFYLSRHMRRAFDAPEVPDSASESRFKESRMRWIWPDITDDSHAVSVSRGGFWASLVYAVSCLIVPGIGVLYGAPFVAVALGIRAKHPGAAGAGLLCQGVLWVAMLSRGAFSIGLLDLLFAFFCVRSLRALLRYHAIVSPQSGVPGRLSVKWILPPLALSVLLSPILISLYVISAGAMKESLLIGDRIVVERVSGWTGRVPHRGDIIVFRYPRDLSETYVSRAVGIPGDRIRLVNKQLFINGEPVVEPYVSHNTYYVEAYRDNFPGTPDVRVYQRGRTMLENHVVAGEVVVPPGQYFAMGDNRDTSDDSRFWGFVPRQNIIGKPLMIYWSYDAPTHRLPDSNGSVAHTKDLVLNFFSKTRWGRTLQLIHPYALTRISVLGVRALMP